VPLEIISDLWAETGALDEDETDDLVPTIAEARVVIRSGDESDSPGDPDRPDHRGAARA
jgi:hypothetical protein